MRNNADQVTATAVAGAVAIGAAAVDGVGQAAGAVIEGFVTAENNADRWMYVKMLFGAPAAGFFLARWAGSDTVESIIWSMPALLCGIVWYGIIVPRWRVR